MLASLLLGSTGCLPRNQNVDLLHARLRQNEDHLAELQAQLQSSQSQLKQARREIDALTTQMAESRPSQLTPEQAGALIQVTSVELQPLLTGGIDQDEEPGDDGLVVYFSPKDDQGEPVKMPGNVRITLSDPSAPAGEQSVGEWTFTPEQCREGWTRGWMGGGYQFTLPWQESPERSRLVVHLDYETPDGRLFDDTELVKVHPSPEALAKRQRSSHHTPPIAEDDEEEDAAAIRQTARKQLVKKPHVLDNEEDPTDEPRMPHSVNWKNDEIPSWR